MTIKFKFDVEKAIDGILDIYENPIAYETNSACFLDREILNIIKENKNPRPLLRTNLLLMKDCKVMNTFLMFYSLLWESIEEDYIERLEKITKKLFNRKKILCYLITAPRCRYSPNERWFMLNIVLSPLVNVKNIGHELFHLHFHEHFFNDISIKLGPEKTHILKEALTVLLNLEFRDLWYSEDRGYASHQELRNFIKNIWEKEKDFDVILELCVKYLLIEKEVK